MKRKHFGMHKSHGYSDKTNSILASKPRRLPLGGSQLAVNACILKLRDGAYWQLLVLPQCGNHGPTSLLKALYEFGARDRLVLRITPFSDHCLHRCERLISVIAFGDRLDDVVVLRTETGCGDSTTELDTVREWPDTVTQVYGRRSAGPIDRRIVRGQNLDVAHDVCVLYGA